MINWKAWEQSLRDRVDVNSALRDSLLKHNFTKTRHPFLLKLSMACIAIATLTVIVTNTSPKVLNSGFITEALAAYDRRTQQLSEDKVRHIVTTWSDGVATQGREEIWQAGDGTFLVISDDYSTLITNDTSYASPEYIAQQQREIDQQAEYRQEDVAREPYRVNMMAGLGGGTGGQGNYFCARVESMGETPASQEFDMTYEAILDAIGYRAGRTIPNTKQALAILAEANGVADLGEVEDPDFGLIHRLRMTIPTRRHGSGYDGIDFDFLADPTTTRFVRIRNWSFNANAVNEATSIITFETDEILDRTSLAENFFDPTSYGFITYTVHYPEDAPDVRPVFTVTESGCYEFHPSTQTFSTVPVNEYDKLPQGLTNMLE